MSLPDWMKREPNDWIKPQRLPLHPLPSVSADVEIARMRVRARGECTLCGGGLGEDSSSYCNSCLKKYGTVGVIHHSMCSKCGKIYEGMQCSCES